jgi:integrase
MASIFKIKDVWYIDYRLKGLRVRHRIGRSRKAADAYLKKIEYDLSLGGRNLIPREYDVDEFNQEYLDYARANKSFTSYQRDKTTVNCLLPFLKNRGIRYLSEITPKLLDDYKVQRLKKAGKATVNRDFNTIRAMLNMAVKWDRIYENPAAKVARVREQEIIPRFLEEKQVAAILKAAKKFYTKSAKQGYLYPLLATAYYGGLRKGELINLEWSDIDDGVIYVRNKGRHTTKSRKDRTVPLHDMLKAILDSVPRVSAWCFTKNGKKLTSTILRKDLPLIVKKSKVDFTLKDLRETFGSQHAMKGTSIYKISQWLGHGSVEITKKHYAHLSPRDEDINRI